MNIKELQEKVSIIQLEKKTRLPIKVLQNICLHLLGASQHVEGGDGREETVSLESLAILHRNAQKSCGTILEFMEIALRINEITKRILLEILIESIEEANLRFNL